MLDPASQTALREEVALQIAQDERVLQQHRDEVRPLMVQTPRIAGRTVSLVAAEGGNDQLPFDPFSCSSFELLSSLNSWSRKKT